jgi:peptide/nickel transport system permease protein
MIPRRSTRRDMDWQSSMSTYALRRILGLIPVLFGVSVVVFLLMQLVPGDVAQALLGLSARPEDIENLRRALGLDQPIWVQYLKWLGMVLHGDLGVSLQQRTAVLPYVLDHFQNTLILTAAATLVSLLIGLPAGIISATRQYSVFDRISMLLALFSNSMPAFWLGLMAILIFSLKLHWFPTGGMWPIIGERTLPVLLSHLALPALTLGAASAAYTARITRSSMLEVIRQDYVRTARAKGLAERIVLMRHALMNALLPVLTVVSLQFGYLLGGAVLTETVFSWPGIGLALYNAISFRDYPLVQGAVLVVATSFVVVNLLTDLLYSVLDPRIRFS